MLKPGPKEISRIVDARGEPVLVVRRNPRPIGMTEEQEIKAIRIITDWEEDPERTASGLAFDLFVLFTAKD